MADILIRGMEMPTDSPVYLTVCPSGGVYVHTYERGYGALVKSQYRVVELPEHGDLIDRDALFKQMGVTDMDCYKCEFGNHGFCGRGGEFSAACEAIEDAPVVVPSNKEETE